MSTHRNKENMKPQNSANQEDLENIHKKIRLHLQGTTKLTKLDVRKLAVKLDNLSCSTPSQMIVLKTAQEILLKIFKDLKKIDENPASTPLRKGILEKSASYCNESITQQNEVELTQNQTFSFEHQSQTINNKNPLIMERSDSYQAHGFISFLPHNETPSSQLGQMTTTQSTQSNSQLTQRDSQLTENNSHQNFTFHPYSLTSRPIGSNENSSSQNYDLTQMSSQEVTQRNYTVLPLTDNVLQLQIGRNEDYSDGNQLSSFPKELLTNENFRTQLTDGDQLTSTQTPYSVQTLMYNVTNPTKTTQPNYSTTHSVQIPFSTTQHSTNTRSIQFIFSPTANPLSPIQPNHSTTSNVQMPALTNENNALIMNYNEPEQSAQCLDSWMKLDDKDGDNQDDSQSTVDLNRQGGPDAVDDCDLDLTQIVENMSIDEDLTRDNLDFDVCPQPNNPSPIFTQTAEPSQFTHSLLSPKNHKLARLESTVSIVENTSSANYPDNEEPLTKKRPLTPQEIVIDETINEKSQSMSLLNIESERNKVATRGHSDDVIIEATLNQSESLNNLETENLMLVDGDVVQQEDEDESEDEEEEIFNKKQQLKVDKVMKVRAKYSDKWNGMDLAERVSPKYAEKFKIRVFEDDVESLIDIGYRPDFNCFHFPRLTQKKSLKKLKKSNDLAAVLLKALSDISATNVQPNAEQHNENAQIINEFVDATPAVAIQNHNQEEEAAGSTRLSDGDSTSSEDTPNHKWLRAYMDKAKVEASKLWNNEEKEDLDDRDEEEVPVLTKEQRFKKMCHEMGRAEWMYFGPDE